MEKNIKQVLSELINIPTYNGVTSAHPIVEYFEKAFAGCKESVVLTDCKGNVHFLIGVNTPLKDVSNAFVFSGHIDTVRAAANHRPKAVYRNGQIEGLGSADMKGFISALIKNLPNFKSFKEPIIFSITSDEETDFYGIETILEEMKRRNISPASVIVGEPTSSNAALTHRGNSIFVGKIIGKACHSSTPELGINAINLSMKAISDLENCILEHRDDASICITHISGGKACNIVPDECTTTISVRANSVNSLRTIEGELKDIYKKIGTEAIDYEIKNVFNIPPFENSGGLMRKIFSPEHQTSMNCASEAGFIQQAYKNADIVIYGPGEQGCIHRAGEKIDLAELSKYCLSLPEIVKKYYILQKEQEGANDTQL